MYSLFFFRYLSGEELDSDESDQESDDDDNDDLDNPEDCTCLEDTSCCGRILFYEILCFLGTFFGVTLVCRFHYYSVSFSCITSSIVL